MGTEIDLTVGSVMVDWSKNRRGRDQCMLFQVQDRTRSEIKDGDDDQPANGEERPGAWRLDRSLRITVPRLDLLGFTLETARVDDES